MYFIVHQRQLTFVHSFSVMARDALPKLIFTARVSFNAKNWIYPCVFKVTPLTGFT